MLVERGWEVGAHTMTHPELPTLSDLDLRRELSESRSTCEARLGRACRSLAYPYGRADSRVVAATAAAGYEVAAGLPGLWHERDPLQFPRVGIYHADASWRFELKVARPVRRLRASPAFEAAVSVVAARRANADRAAHPLDTE